MNEKIEKGREMAAYETDIKKVIGMIAENALKTRPKRAVYYKPFQPVPGIRYERSLANVLVNLNQIYPGAEEGDIAYVEFDILTETDYDIYISVNGTAALFFEGERLFSSIDGKPEPETAFSWGHFNVPVTVRRSRPNRVRIKCVKHGAQFGCSYILSIRRYPGMWANDYIYACRNTPPAREFYGENGVAVSELFHTGLSPEGALADCNRDYEPVPYRFPVCPKDGVFDFQHLCGRGDCAYVYTAVKADCIPAMEGTVGAVWVDGKPYEAGTGVKTGQKLLIRVDRGEGEWSLTLQEDQLRLPFLDCGRPAGAGALWLGPFYGKKKHAPEYGLQLEKVYRNEKGEKVFWGLSDGSRLQILLDSVFYGQWFYALMVGFYGIRLAGSALGKAEYETLFCENLHFLAQYFDYITYEAEQNGMPPFMPRAIDIRDLDNIGTMGMNLIDGYLDSNDETLLPLIEKLKGFLLERVPRLPDGTFYRIETMWADDVFMSCPFMARLGVLTGDSFWEEEILRQIRGFRQRLFMEDQNIFSHIFFVKEGKANRIPWGRGNGWIFWTLTEVLERMENPALFAELLELYQRFAAGLRPLQDESGLWRQVLNSREAGSYPETSCTAMFLLGMVRGVKNGWLGEEYRDSIRRAWAGLLARSIDREGNIYGVCMGSGCSMEPRYYYDIPTIQNDDHGTGIILAAAVEYERLLRKGKDGKENE